MDPYRYLLWVLERAPKLAQTADETWGKADSCPGVGGVQRIPERKGLTMKLKHYGAMLVNFVIAYANGDMSRREFDLNYSGYMVDFFPRFKQEHPLLARRFADTIERIYDDCSWMPDDRFQDAISAVVDKFMGEMSEADLY